MYEDIKKTLMQSKKLMEYVDNYKNPVEVMLTEDAPVNLKNQCKGKKVYLMEVNPCRINIGGTYKIIEVKPNHIMFESEKSYADSFKSAMKKFGITKIGDLKNNEQKKKFFDYVDKIWTSADEKKNEGLPLYTKEEAKNLKQQAAIAIAKKEKKEVSPPGREDQVKKLKKIKPKAKDGTKLNPYAIAWAQHNKHGKPD